MTTDETIAQYKQHVIANYNRFPISLVRGAGSEVWDAEGRRYLDLFPGWGCGLLGHCPPAIVEAVQQQVAKLIHVPNSWYTEPQGQLAQALGSRTDFKGMCFFCNSGTEANEAAIKLARLNGRESGPNRSHRYKIITMLDSFHGRTMGSLSATAQPKYHHGVEPMLPGFGYVPYGDLEAVERKIDAETIAVMIEPIQGEGGVNIPPDDYMQGLRALCDRHKLLLICDEVQSGMGRTGQWYAHQHWGIKPDIVTLAKAVAGGVALGGLIAKPEVAEKLRPGTHAATFGGNPIACVAALATIETIERENLLARAGWLAETFRERFTKLRERCPVIQEVRARGAMIGIQLATDGVPAVQKALERGLLINCTHSTVIRLLPALNIPKAHLDEGIGLLEDVLLSM